MLGATPESEKQEIRDGLANGEIKLVIGTHALIEDPVTFADLQLTIIDEQHRFGVGQRAALRAKGDNPHLMVMTATPIPRSLALTVYGDLDLLVMDEMPPGRQVVETYILLPRERERAYSLIRKQVSEGSQAFIIYPLIEDKSSVSEAQDDDASKAAVDEHQRLQSEGFNLSCGSWGRHTKRNSHPDRGCKSFWPSAATPVSRASRSRSSPGILPFDPRY
jgi:ATP-dependent DNA helicase RecG